MLSEVIKLVHENKISLDHARKIIYEAIEKKIDPCELIAKQNLHQINDESELLALISSIMEENKEIVRQYIEDDNTHVVNFFIGKVMQTTKRSANPNRSMVLIKEELERRKNEK